MITEKIKEMIPDHILKKLFPDGDEDLSKVEVKELPHKNTGHDQALTTDQGELFD